MRRKRLLQSLIVLTIVFLAVLLYVSYCTPQPPPPIVTTAVPPTATYTATAIEMATFTPTSTATWTATASPTATVTPTRTPKPLPPTVTFTPVSPLNYRWWNCYSQTWMDYPRLGWSPCSEAKSSE